MRVWTRVLMALGMSVLWTTGALAVPPAYSGPFGNPEEPGLRPFKWMWRGVKAFAYQPVVALDQGNRKIPGLGSAEVFRGLRKGSIELDESVFRGMIGSVPPDAKDYRKLSTVNTVVDNDLLLRNATDFASCAYIGLITPASAAFGSTAGTFVMQKIADHCPVVSRDKQVELAKQAEQVREGRKAARAQAAAASGKSGVERAQEKYLGDRAIINKKPKLAGDLIGLAR